MKKHKQTKKKGTIMNAQEAINEAQKALDKAQKKLEETRIPQIIESISLSAGMGCFSTYESLLLSEVEELKKKGFNVKKKHHAYCSNYNPLKASYLIWWGNEEPKDWWDHTYEWFSHDTYFKIFSIASPFILIFLWTFVLKR